MAAGGFLNVARFLANASGTGDFVVSSAIAGFQTPASAGAVNATVYSYRAESTDLTEWEIGEGAYTSGTTTLARTTIHASSNAGAAVNFTAAPQVAIVELAGDQRPYVTIPAYNILDNGDFAVSQRNANVGTSTADNAYFADRWRYLGEATNTLYGALSDAAGNTTGAVEFDGTTDKGGVFQVVEGLNCKHLRSTAVVFSAKIRVTNTRLGNIKMGIIEFTGTEDATTGDPISAWNADGTTPTLAANWAFLNTPANLSVTTSAATYSVTATVGASANNLAVFIWNDDKSYTANDTLVVTDAQLEIGGIASPFQRMHYSENLRRCQRYYYRRKAISTTDPICVMQVFSTTQAFGKLLDFPVTMRSTPTASVSAAGDFYLFNTTGTGIAVTAVDLASSNTHSVSSYNGLTVAAGLTAGSASILTFNTTSGFIAATAEL